MRVVLGMSAFLAGCLILVAVWFHMLRTVLARGQRPSLLMRIVLRRVPTVMRALVRTLPGRAHAWALSLLGPFMLISVLACWLAVSFLGFALIVVSFGGVPVTPPKPTWWLTGADVAGSVDTAQTQWRDGAVALVGWVNAGIVVVAFAAHLACFVSAYNRREVVVSMLATQARRPTDAERLLARYLRCGMVVQLDNTLARWAHWLADVQLTHTAFPTLLLCRSSTSLNWLTAAVIMLDTAALMNAIAPSRTPPHTHTLLCTGMHCLQGLHRQIGISQLPAVVSFEGREEVDFHKTLYEVVAAGLPAERDEAHALMIFQELRIQYSPYATAIATYLRYDARV